MTDNETDKLDIVIQRLDQIIRMMTTAVVPNPNDKLDQIIQQQNALSES